mmetsp:Transcript_8572/g.25405  ORF Transcript_8572/g.25405 Transcript_8572/m.25405 type:complete len:80 (+) Transcript_8572:198-437(+)
MMFHSPGFGAIRSDAVRAEGFTFSLIDSRMFMNYEVQVLVFSFKIMMVCRLRVVQSKTAIIFKHLHELKCRISNPITVN